MKCGAYFNQLKSKYELILSFKLKFEAYFKHLKRKQELTLRLKMK